MKHLIYLPTILNGFTKPVILKSARARLTTNILPTFLSGFKNVDAQNVRVQILEIKILVLKTIKLP